MKKIICLMAVLLVPHFSFLYAQTDDFGMWYELGVEKKLSKKWSLGFEGEFRTRNNSRTADRWSAGLSAEYKFVKGLKASAGYTFLYDNNGEELTYKNNLPNKWTPSYWGARHRLYAGLTGSVNWNRFTLSLRERWQYTYRPEAQEKKYNFQWNEDANDNSYISGYQKESVKGKGKHVLRSRLQLGYDIPNCKFDPSLSTEMFAAGNGIEKMRYQLGIDYKYKKQHVFSLTYRYQNISGDDDDNDRNSHLIGLGYTFKF
jgi:hypothetical protein